MKHRPFVLGVVASTAFAASVDAETKRAATKKSTPATAATVNASTTRDADQLFRRHNFAGAAAAYQKLAAASPGAAEPRFKLAVALTALERWKDALAAWDDVLAIEPRNAAARLYRERVDEKAAKVIETTAPSTDDALKRAALALHDGAPSFVLRLTETALVAAPGRVDALILRARALAALGRFDEAVTAIRRALSQTPGDPRAHFALGETHRHLGEREKARTAYARFLAIVDPANTEFSRDVAFARRYLGKRP